jgi:hypothetical protein
MPRQGTAYGTGALLCQLQHIGLMEYAGVLRMAGAA